MVEIVWTEIALADFKEVFEYIAEDSLRYANITTTRLYERVQEVTTNPLMGRIVPETNKESIRELIEGNYRIIYRIKNKNQVAILRIFHSARLLKKKLIK